MIYTSFNDFFAVLSSKQRVKILQLLNREGPHCVNQIKNKLKVEQSAISHDMKRLLGCRFVFVERKGKERVYSINKTIIQPLFNLIREHVEAHCVRKDNKWND